MLDLFSSKNAKKPVVVLCNFGGPASKEAVEPFLRTLFEDPFIIRAPLKPWFRSWLAKRIAKKRALKAQAEYETFGYSPINRMTEAQRAHLEENLKKLHPETKVYTVNRYTAPFAKDVVKKLDPKRDQVFVITLYPHLCHSTTVSSLRDFDLALKEEFGTLAWPMVRVYSWWHNPQFLDFSFASLKEALEKALATEDKKTPISVIFSAHGIPVRYHDRGDPYVQETMGHVQALIERTTSWLSPEDRERCYFDLSFQSRVGPVTWVKPYTEDVIKEKGQSRGGHFILVPISFTSDHIETLFEMDKTYKELGLSSGFKTYSRVVPANDNPKLAHALTEILKQHGFPVGT